MTTSPASSSSKALTAWKQNSGSLVHGPATPPRSRSTTQKRVPRSGSQRKFSMKGRSASASESGFTTNGPSKTIAWRGVRPKECW
jgi:hypothetical protein